MIMEDNEPQFGMSPIVDHQAKYLETYVVLSPQGNSTISGRLVQIVQGYFVLNPFQSGKIENGALRDYLKELSPGRSVPMINTGIEPTTLETIEEFFESVYKSRIESVRKSNN